MGYANPLLTEIYAETHLEPSSFPPERFFDVVPRLKASGFPTIEMVDAISLKPGENPIAESTPRIRCWNEEKTRLVQLSPDLVIVNLVGRYPGWASFKDLFTVTHNALAAALGSITPESLSLNAIDKFQAPREGYTMGRYLSCDGKWIPRWYEDSREAVDINLGRGLVQEDGRNRQLLVRIRVKEKVEGMIRSGFHDKLGTPARLDQCLSELHSESVALFESLITDETRSTLMGGREP